MRASLILFVWLGFLLVGCVAGSIPNGSQLLGTFKGILRGNVYDGPIQVQLFQTRERSLS